MSRTPQPRYPVADRLRRHIWVMKPRLHHPFDLTPGEAMALQRRLAARAVFTRDCDLRRVRLVLATDVAYSRLTDRAYGAAVLWDLRGRDREGRAGIGAPVAQATAELIPGLLTFREAPVLIEARSPRRPAAPRGDALASASGRGSGSGRGIAAPRERRS